MNLQLLLPGATAKDRMLASLGALASIGLCGWLTAILAGEGWATAFIVAPMGASAVLVFAVPSSPLAQPWPVVGGNVVSALIGVAAAHFIPNLAVAAGVAVGLAIAAMTVTRTLHPPGGAAALLAVVIGSQDAGWLFPLMPVGINAILLTLLGIGFHRLTPHRYPARQAKPEPHPHGTSDVLPRLRLGVQSEDIDRAVADIGEAFDISRDDIACLIRTVERRALERTHGRLTCADVMSRDVIKVGCGTTIQAALRLALERGVRLLPVVNADEAVLGSVGLRELILPGEIVDDVLSPPLLAAPEWEVISLIDPLTSGRHHAAVVIDPAKRLLGVLTQTDLLLALARSPVLAD